jgi:hypothetical protein
VRADAGRAIHDLHEIEVLVFGIDEGRAVRREVAPRTVTLLLLRDETGTLVAAGPDLELNVPAGGLSGIP